MRTLALVVTAVLAATAAPAFAAEAPMVQVSVLQDGAPNANVALVLEIANQGKVSLGTTDAEGQGSFALDVANLGKVQVEIVVEDCPAEDTVYLVGPEGQLPPEKDECKRRRAGFFWWGKARRITVDVARGTLVTTGAGLGKAPIYGGAGALVVLTGLGLAGGGSGAPAATPTVTNTPTTGTPTSGTPVQPATGTPAGSYNVVTIVVVTDLDGHREFVNLTVRVVQLSGSGPALMMTGDGNFQPIEINVAADGSFAGEGRGAFAGRPNIPFRVSGTLNTTTRRMLFRIVIGGGLLPGRGNDITYELQLQG